jgi:parallel beta helix pectate lyase-like protein
MRVYHRCTTETKFHCGAGSAATFLNIDRVERSSEFETLCNLAKPHAGTTLNLWGHGWTLTGTFTLDAAPLLLQSRTALVLDGTIDVPYASGASEAIRGANPSEFISISGGTIELNGRSMEGIFFLSTTTAYVDGVTVRRAGERDVRAGKGMIHLQRGGGYTILRGNTVDTSGGRCIWTQNSNTRFVVIENYLTNCNQDGVDFDSSTRNSLAIGNQSVDNLRYGLFLEQSDSLNKIYGNYVTTRGIPTIPGRAVGVYNNATSSGTRGTTDKNTVFINVSDVIADGLRVGSISTATGGVAETAHTFLFNNVVRNSRGNLLTREALALYDRKLAPSGIVACHISNRHLDLGSLVRATAEDLGLASTLDAGPPSSGAPAMVMPSRWAFLARSPDALRARDLPSIVTFVLRKRGRTWTDDRSDLWSVFQW